MLDLLDSPGVVHAIYALGSMALFSIGLYGLLAKRHLLKIFISIAVMELSVYLLFVALATSPGETAPILADGLTRFTAMADPVPQALTLTAIVIGMAVLAFGVTLAIHYHRLTGTRDIGAMTELKD
ncbi:multisubunit Na+/H+ antiporter, MnhC subunit [Thioflavicoccus mobilis 8321]|uniref:Multisubunit Na+/H+ antiporter, MnhC subunit n=1 Tax=Thioflavicoccus mobilis 8321 TaxID=765912 RepID=L0GZ82_9GAMM|nr:sodium:proton antiporter [Thioflavicoccus mobilis]AGA91142.1 multisubunit Na+/H+ antiporter, MnhC subunit [Thioflavicoccus mobilis 8321]